MNIREMMERQDEDILFVGGYFFIVALLIITALLATNFLGDHRPADEDAEICVCECIVR